jgi:hypothetical protein
MNVKVGQQPASMRSRRSGLAAPAARRAAAQRACARARATATAAVAPLPTEVWEMTAQAAEAVKASAADVSA